MRAFIFIYFFFLFISCSINETHKTSEFRNLTTDSLLLDYQSSKTTTLNLYPIDKGVDSFELRIWYGLAIARPKQIIILKFQDSSWRLSRTDYWLSIEENYPKKEKIILDSCFTTSLKPLADISEIVDSINTFGLESFPSQDEIPEFRDNVADGMSFTIELATRRHYKALQYNNPKFYKDSFNLKMTRFLSYLNKIGVNTIY